MQTLIRTDVHRPSAIDPEAYEFVAVTYIGGSELDLGEQLELVYQRKVFNAHRDRTAGVLSGHRHGGTCHICGAHALYLAIFYHRGSNSYIQSGEDCAAKLDMGQPEAFNAARQSIADARACIAGKRKAQAVLADCGLTEAWRLYENYQGAPYGGDEATAFCIVDNLVRYGNLSDKQIAFLKTLLYRLVNAQEVAAQRAAEKAAALPCPVGRQMVELTVLKTEVRDSMYGVQIKMTGKHADGWLVWGTVPASLELFEDSAGYQRGLKRGDVVKFTATIERSDRDEKFGFYKRPSKASLVREAVA
jgi:hypothetical protein